MNKLWIVLKGREWVLWDVIKIIFIGKCIDLSVFFGGNKDLCDVLCKLRRELWSEYLNEWINNEILNKWFN